jgi:hypothetical protein
MSANDLRNLMPQLLEEEGHIDNNSIDLITRIKGAFDDFIGVPDNDYYNYTLNYRYGIEMEFLSIKNRFDLANRMNNCMFHQNHDWWKNNFDAFNILKDGQNNLQQGNRMLTMNNNDFDEYSSFFTEASFEHGSKTHRGSHHCNRRGIAGFRIELDPTVTFDREARGVTVWSKAAYRYFNSTELTENVQPGHTYGREYQVLERLISLRQEPSSLCYQFTTPEGQEPIYLNDANPYNRLAAFPYNELVSNVLTNNRILYPFKNRGNGNYTPGQLPLGSLMIDNTFNHMLSHKSVLFVQKSGFHVHLSEFPRVRPDQKVHIIIGFIKLFYVFEPLIFSFFPGYRAESYFCRSLQSVFTRDEVAMHDIELYNDLLGLSTDHDGNLASRIARNRQLDENGDRYLSLNIMNCREGGIGTIEIRLGHSTFDSKFVQAYIHFLQTLFHLNIAMLNYRVNGHRQGFGFHNLLLNSNIIPHYCVVSARIYNGSTQNRPRERVALRGEPNGIRGAPIHGFFVSMGNGPNDLRAKSSIIRRLYKLFFALTNSESTLRILSQHTNFYHTNTNSWLCSQNMYRIDIDRIITEVGNEIRMGQTRNPFRAIRSVESYAINRNRDGTFKMDYSHECKSCVKNNLNQCAPLFNNGVNVISSQNPRIVNSEYDESTAYTQSCPDGMDIPGKTQCELLTRKTSRGIYSGGKRTSKNGYRNLNKRSHKKLKKISLQKHKTILKGQGTNNSVNMESSRINAEAHRIIIINDEDKYKALLIDWMGTSVELELLSKIINNLIDNKIIDKNILNKLVDNRYIDYHIFRSTSNTHIMQLIDELSMLDINPETVVKIIDVYNTTKLPPNKDAIMITTLPEYTPILANEE